MDFEIIAIFDSRLIKQIIQPNDAILRNYNYQFCPTEVDPDGIVIYILDYLSYKTWNNLDIHEPFELESAFVEICNPKKRIILLNSKRAVTTNLCGFLKNVPSKKWVKPFLL